MAQYVDLVQLRQALTEYYNEGELRTMCFDLSIDYESLGGRGKAEKVGELILYARRNNRVDEIAKYVRRTRPFIQFTMTDTPPPPLDEASGSGSGITHVTNVYGDQIGGDKVGGDKITTGNISDSSGVALGRGASAAVHINQPAPQDKAAFTQQIEALRALLAQAIADGAFANANDGRDAADDLDKVLREAEKDQPHAERITSRLETVKAVIESGAKVGTAVLKATPIIAGLIKAASLIF